MENPVMRHKLCPHHMRGKCAGLEIGFDLASKSQGIWKISKCKRPCEALTERDFTVGAGVGELIYFMIYYNREQFQPPSSCI